MHIICPHCHNPVELVQVRAAEEITCSTCGSSFHLETESTTRGPTLQGRKLGRFELLETVGQGAFGTVYKARDPDLDRFVALKVPRAGSLAGLEELDRFVREARSAGQLQHPSIVAVHEVGRADEVPFLVSEFVEGVPLSDHLSGRQLTAREAASLIADVADALHYAHERGVVHRDVKPSNILLDGQRRPHVLDFGLARRDSGEITVTMDGQVLGTPAYMSPEQARGEGHRVDGSSDVYSLGVILYELLTGELPFRGTKRMLLYQVLHDEPRPPRRLNDTIPRDLETICLKAMAKEPARRYPTAAALADDLRRFQGGRPITARPVTAFERFLRTVRRQPLISSLAAALVAGALVSLAVFLALWLRAEDEKGQKARALLDAQTQTDIALRAQEDERKKNEELIAANEEKQRQTQAAVRAAAKEARARGDERLQTHFLRIALARREVEAGNVDRAEVLLQQCPEELRGWEWGYLERRCRPELLTLDYAAGEMAVSPDGRLLAARSQRRRTPKDKGDTGEEVSVWDLTSGKALYRRDLEGASAPPFLFGGGIGDARRSTLLFSPDGKRLATVGTFAESKGGKHRSGSRVLLHEPRSGEVAGRYEVDGWVRTAWFSADGRRLSLLTVGVKPEDHDRVRVLDAATAKAVESFRLSERLQGFPAGAVDGVTFSPDGRRAGLVARFDSRATVWDVASGKKLLSVSVPTSRFGAGLTQACLSPDGRRLAVNVGTVAEKTGYVYVYDVEGGRQTDRLEFHELMLSALAFSPDGLHLAGGTSSRGIYLWPLGEGKPVFVRREVAAREDIADIAFSPDGLRLLASDGARITVHDLTATPEKRRLPRIGGPVQALAFNADGTQLAVACTPGVSFSAGEHTGYVSVWDARTGDPRAVFTGHKKWPRCVAFAPDGRRIASGDDAGVLLLWEVPTNKVLHELSTPGRGTVTEVAFSADGKWLADASARAAGKNRFTSVVEVWDWQSAQRRHTLDPGEGVTALAFSPDGTRLLTATAGGEVRTWDAAAGRELDRRQLGAGTVAFHRDGRHVAVATSEQRAARGQAPEDGRTRVRIWDLAEGKPLYEYVLHLDHIASLAYSSDGKRLVVRSGGFNKPIVLVCDAATGNEAWTIDTGYRIGSNLRLAMSPTGDRIAAGGTEFDIFVWDGEVPRPAAQAARRLALEQGRKARLLNLARYAQMEERKDLQLFYLDRAVEAFPDRLDARFERAQARAGYGLWEEARADFAGLARLKAANSEVRMHYALLCLRTGKEEEYRQFCAAWRKAAELTQDLEERNSAAYACCLAPGAVKDPDRLPALARACVDAQPKNYAYRNTLGATLYRAGDDAAVRELLEAVKLHGRGGDPQDWLFLALAYQRKGDADNAGKWFARAKEWNEQLTNPRAPVRPVLAWPTRLEIGLLYTEAARAIEKKKPPTPASLRSTGALLQSPKGLQRQKTG